MNHKNKVNEVALRRLVKKFCSTYEEKQSVMRFNSGRGYEKTKIRLGVIGFFVLASLAFTTSGFLDLGIAMGAYGAVVMAISWATTFSKEKAYGETFSMIVEELENNERCFTARFEQFPKIKLAFKIINAANTPELDDNDEWQFWLDWTRKEIILMARKIKAGDESLRGELKINLAAAIMMFSKNFDRGQGYDLFFNEKIISEMTYFKEEL